MCILLELQRSGRKSFIRVPDEGENGIHLRTQNEVSFRPGLLLRCIHPRLRIGLHRGEYRPLRCRESVQQGFAWFFRQVRVTLRAT